MLTLHYLDGDFVVAYVRQLTSAPNITMTNRYKSDRTGVTRVFPVYDLWIPASYAHGPFTMSMKGLVEKAITSHDLSDPKVYDFGRPTGTPYRLDDEELYALAIAQLKGQELLPSIRGENNLSHDSIHGKLICGGSALSGNTPTYGTAPWLFGIDRPIVTVKSINALTLSDTRLNSVSWGPTATIYDLQSLAKVLIELGKVADVPRVHTVGTTSYTYTRSTTVTGYIADVSSEEFSYLGDVTITQNNGTKTYMSYYVTIKSLFSPKTAVSASGTSTLQFTMYQTCKVSLYDYVINDVRQSGALYDSVEFDLVVDNNLYCYPQSTSVGLEGGAVNFIDARDTIIGPENIGIPAIVSTGLKSRCDSIVASMGNLLDDAAKYTTNEAIANGFKAEGSNLIEALAEVDEIFQTFQIIPDFTRLISYARTGRFGKAGKEVVNMASSRYLQWLFGIQPTISDAHYLANKAFGDVPLFKKGAPCGNLYGTFTIPWSGSINGVSETIEVTVRTKIRYELDLHSFALSYMRLAQFGIDPLSLATWWDLVPFSWLLDSFTNAFKGLFKEVDSSVRLAFLQPKYYVHTYTFSSPLKREWLLPYGLHAVGTDAKVKTFHRKVSQLYPGLPGYSFRAYTARSSPNLITIGALIGANI